MLEERIYPTYKVAALSQVLAQQGVSPERLLEKTVLAPEDILSNTTRISQSQLIQIYRNAVAITRDSAIALQVGQRLGMTNYGIYGYALISSATLREALLFSIKYHQMATPTVRMTLLDEPDQEFAVFRFTDLLRVDSLYVFNLELQFSLVFSLFKDMVGSDFRYRTIRARFPMPKHAPAYRDVFECSASFKQDEDEVRFDKHWLDAPLVKANPITAATARELCDQILLEMRTREGVAQDVYRVITEDLRCFNRIEAVAERLNMSARTLRRKLAEQGKTYHGILTDVRKQLAIEFLRHSKFSSEEIADRLGFTDAANFRHAFKKWTGKNTSDYR
ncbi:MAG: AraC family transcriptional regulator [Pseudomonadota bacterium]